MRRGLIARSQTELPDAVLEARLSRVRATMAKAQLDALIVYTNNTRPAGVSWLTGFVPYWSEALLVVPREGEPYLVAALSFRVKTWIERVSRLGDVLHTPRVGLKAAQQIAAMRVGVNVGIVDFDGLPTGIAVDLHEAGQGLTFRDASAEFAALRAKADPTEIALTTKAATIARRALAAARGDDLNSIIAIVESEARANGAEEIYLAAVPDLERSSRFIRIEGDLPLGQQFALRATVAYKGAWIRLVRCFCRPQIAHDAAARFAAAVAALPSERGFSGFRSWLVEGCRLTQPLDPLCGTRIDDARPLPAGALVSVQAWLSFEGVVLPLGAPALLGSDGEAASLLADPVFE